MHTEKRLSESLEDYLEAIYHIVAAKRAARATDIAKRLEVQNSSVTQALKALKERGLVNYAPYDLVTLTDEGERLAAAVVKRHTTLREFLTRVLLLGEETAEKNACRMEHVVDSILMERLIAYLSFLDRCPLGKVRMRPDGAFLCAVGETDGNCEKCRILSGLKM
jgi:DtxR family Mn-dependent transcriptional regulator